MSVPERTSSGKYFGERSGRLKCYYCGGEKELFVVTLDGFEKRACHICGGTGYMPSPLELSARARIEALSSRIGSRRRSIAKST